MFIEKLVSEGLAHFSYIAGNDKDAFVVDSKKDVDSYIEIAKSYRRHDSMEGERLSYIQRLKIINQDDKVKS